MSPGGFTGASGSIGAKGQTRIEEPERWERAVARRSAESRATVPELTAEVEVEVDGAAAVAAAAGCGLGALVALHCARALRNHPRANAAYRDAHFEHPERVNLGWVVATPEIYTIPTVFDADRLSLSDLCAEISSRIRRALSGELSPPELGGATFTMWDAGALGLSRAAAPVVPPQAGALCAGAPRGVARSRDGDIVPVHVMTLTLACDHRILYGAGAAAFLNAIKTRLEEEHP